MLLRTPISGLSMRTCRLLSLLALLAAGCGGAGEARTPDGSPPSDAPFDMSGAAGLTGAGGRGGGGNGGAAGSTAIGAEIGTACDAAGDCKSGFCFDSICC